MVYKEIKKYMIAAVFLFVVDMIWLLIIIKPFMDNWLSNLARDQYIAWSAFLAWFLIPLGILLLVERTSKSIKESAFYGAVYGLCLYGVYEFTNYAIINTWALPMLIVDIIWGTVLCCLTAVFLRYVSLKWLK